MVACSINSVYPMWQGDKSCNVQIAKQGTHYRRTNRVNEDKLVQQMLSIAEEADSQSKVRVLDT